MLTVNKLYVWGLKLVIAGDGGRSKATVVVGHLVVEVEADDAEERAA